MSRKKVLVCEVLTTIRGLDSKDPSKKLTAGTADNPTLIELPDNEETRTLIDANALRIWPGPKEEGKGKEVRITTVAELRKEYPELVALVEAEAVAEGKPAKLAALGKAQTVLPSLIERYRKELEAADDDKARKAIEKDIAEIEKELAAVEEALK